MNIVSTPLMDEPTRSELLACIGDCSNGVSEMQLTLETVRLLKSKGDAVATQIKIVWHDTAQRYSDGSKGYLSMIGGLSSDPRRAKELADNITQTVAGDLSIKAVNSLVSDVAEAKRIADNFSLNPEIEGFLKKVSSQQATALDLTPSILAWLKEKNLMITASVFSTRRIFSSRHPLSSTTRIPFPGIRIQTSDSLPKT